MLRILILYFVKSHQVHGDFTKGNKLGVKALYIFRSSGTDSVMCIEYFKTHITLLIILFFKLIERN